MAGKPSTRKGLAVLAKIDPQEVIERHAQGDSIATMKKDYGVTTEAWYAWVKSHDGLMDTLRTVRLNRANDLPWEALEIADTAKPENIAVARERIRTRLWMAERAGTEFRPKQEVTHEVNVIHQHLEALKQAQDVMEAEIISVEEEG